MGGGKHQRGEPVERDRLGEQGPQLRLAEAPMLCRDQVDRGHRATTETRPREPALQKPFTREVAGDDAQLRRPRKQIEVSALRWRRAENQHPVTQATVDRTGQLGSGQLCATESHVHIFTADDVLPVEHKNPLVRPKVPRVLVFWWLTQ